jgi:hypothetical protein
MGLSIFYSGMLRSVDLLPHLVDEITDICDGLHWPCALYAPTPEYPIEGIVFNPPGAQDIFMTFLNDGRLADPDSLYTMNGFRIPSANEEITLNPIVQYAGPDAQMQLISMMRHMSKKYFFKFRFVDESEYWKTGDEQKCRDWFAMFNVWMDTMSEDLGKLDSRGHEGGASYHTRLKDLLQNGTSPDDISKALGNPYRRTWKNGKWLDGYGVR